MGGSVSIFVNPNSASKKSKVKVLEKIKVYLAKHNIAHNFFYSSSLFEFEMKLTEVIGNGCKKILVFGGDGSIHWLVNYMAAMNINQSDFSIGLLSGGTGNDWLKTYTSGDQIDYVLNLVLDNKTKKQDLGVIKNENMSPRIFVNIAGVGFNGEVIQNVDRWLFFKSFSYYVALVETFFGYKYKTSTLFFKKNNIKKQLFIATVGVCRYAGGNMKLCPDANPWDGLFDINIIPKMRFFEFVNALLSLKSGNYIQNPKIHTFLSDFIKVESENTIHCEADGEYLGAGTFEFEIYKNDFNFYI